LVLAQKQAIGWIGQTILSQAQLLSYMDVFYWCALFSLLMVPLALSLKKVQLGQAPAGH
jgi:DHA2 family multidrug resistance protein